MGLGLEADLHPAKNRQIASDRIVTGRLFAERSQSIGRRKNKKLI